MRSESFDGIRQRALDFPAAQEVLVQEPRAGAGPESPNAHPHRRAARLAWPVRPSVLHPPEARSPPRPQPFIYRHLPARLPAPFAGASPARQASPWCNLDYRHGSSFRPVPGLVFKTSGRRGCARRWVRPPRASASQLFERAVGSPVRKLKGMERETRLELATNSLEGCDSTFELLPLEGAALLL